LRILDVGCGVGGTTRYLAGELGAAVTGITISGKQVQIAGRLSKAASSSTASGSVPAASSAVDGTPAAVDGNGAAAAQATNGDGDGSKKDGNKEDGDGFIPLGDKGGKVRFIELDAEKMGEFFSPGQGEGKEQGGFDVVWISEALSHFPNKALFFHNAHKLLRPGGKLVLADWFRAEGLGEGVFEADIKPIEGLWPPSFFHLSFSSFLFSPFLFFK
jgi:SAM-dependent methyltransferase